jgi:hypothetical protein
VTCLNEVSADVLRTFLSLTRHSSLWMNDVYQSVHDPIGKWPEAACFAGHASVYGALAGAKHVSINPRIH